MTELMKVLYSFWSGFGISAYPENAVPDNAVLPYITYEIAETNMENELLSAQVWFNSTTFTGMNTVLDSISDSIGQGKKLVLNNKTIAYIYKGSPWIQMRTMDKIENKTALLNYGIITRQ